MYLVCFAWACGFVSICVCGFGLARSLLFADLFFCFFWLCGSLVCLLAGVFEVVGTKGYGLGFTDYASGLTGTKPEFRGSIVRSQCFSIWSCWLWGFVT